MSLHGIADSYYLLWVDAFSALVLNDHFRLIIYFIVGRWLQFKFDQNVILTVYIIAIFVFFIMLILIRASSRYFYMVLRHGRWLWSYQGRSMHWIIAALDVSWTYSGRNSSPMTRYAPILGSHFYQTLSAAVIYLGLCYPSNLLLEYSVSTLASTHLEYLMFLLNY